MRTAHVSPRPLILTLGVVALFVAIPAAANHPENPENFGHLNIDVQDLAPGESRSLHLESPEGPLRAGWVYIIYGGVQGNASVIVNLTFEETTLEDQFVWSPGGFHKNSTKIKNSGAHELVLYNPSKTDTVRYAFYYDQSCNCAGKLIPLAGGFVLFNYEFPESTRVQIEYPLIEGWGLRGSIARLDPSASNAHWPTDFNVLQTREASGPEPIAFDFETVERGTYYVFLEATEGGAPNDPIQLSPLIDVEDPVKPEAAPGAGFLGGIVAGTLLAAFAGKRRSRGL